MKFVCLNHIIAYLLKTCCIPSCFFNEKGSKIVSRLILVNKRHWPFTIPLSDVPLTSVCQTNLCDEV